VLTFKAEGRKLALEIEGLGTFEAMDNPYDYGMVGYALYANGRVGFGNLQVKEF
jgi:hypothetical protein